MRTAGTAVAAGSMSDFSPDEPLSPLTIAVDAICPYCGEPISLVADISIPDQSYIEDCSVCCRPITIDCSAENGQLESFRVRAENE